MSDFKNIREPYKSVRVAGALLKRLHKLKIICLVGGVQAHNFANFVRLSDYLCVCLRLNIENMKNIFLF